MADNWKKLGDTVAELVRLHHSAEREEAAYREKAFRLEIDNKDLQQKLMVAREKNLKLARELARLRG